MSLAAWPALVTVAGSAVLLCAGLFVFCWFMLPTSPVPEVAQKTLTTTQRVTTNLANDSTPASGAPDQGGDPVKGLSETTSPDSSLSARVQRPSTTPDSDTRRNTLVQSQSATDASTRADPPVLPLLQARYGISLARHGGDGSMVMLSYDPRKADLRESLENASNATLMEVGTFTSSEAVRFFFRAVNAANPPGGFNVTFSDQYRRVNGIIEQEVGQAARPTPIAYLSYGNSDRSSFVISISDKNGEVREEIVQAGRKAVETVRELHGESGSTQALATFSDEIRASNVAFPFFARLIDPYGRVNGTLQYLPDDGSLVVHWACYNSDMSIIAFSVTDSNGKICDQLIAAGRRGLEEVRDKHQVLSVGAGATFRESVMSLGIKDPVFAAFYGPSGQLLEAVQCGP